MEIKKSPKADLEREKSTGLLIGYIFALAAMFACFEFTTREYKDNSQIYAAAPVVSEEEYTPPPTQPIFTAAPPPPAESVETPEILDIVDDNTDIVEEKVETSEATNDAIAGPSAPVSGPVMAGPPVATAEEGDEGEIFEVVEQSASFPGGDDALYKWLGKNLRYPASANEQGIQGRVIVAFVINRDGSIVDPKVMRSLDPACDKEALRVIKSMPKWTPGKQRGKTVRQRYVLPVMFKLM